jgi:4-carboxymuconolactone decarboxylase
MARLPYLDPEDAEPHTAPVLRKAPDLGIFRMAANAQWAFPAWMRFGGTLCDPAWAEQPPERAGVAGRIDG